MQENQNSAANNTTSWRRDFLASIVVFLVALPLCMGIAIASGVPVAAGLITGIIGGLVVGWIAGCPLQVSGPAAGLTVIVYEIVQEFGVEMLGIVVLMAGAIQLVAGVLKLGQWFRAVSPAVIQGMLAGIGVLILASQFHVMVDDKPKGSGLENLLTLPGAVLKGLSLSDLGTREQRAERTSLLLEVGELHRRQSQLASRVAEHLPDHATPDQLAAETQLQIAAESASLLALAPYQEQITGDLDRLVAKIDALHVNDLNKEKIADIRRAAALAASRCDAAQQDLLSGQVRHATLSQSQAVSAMEGLSGSLKNHSLAAQVGLLTIIVIVLWGSFATQRMRLIPGPLVAVTVATLFAAGFSLPVLYVEIPTNLASEIHFPVWDILTDAPWLGLIEAAVVVAVIASAETLLCATAVDQMHTGQRTRYDKELTAQGIGNMVCGLVGALPMTGVIVRSSANIQAGATSRASAILHGAWLLIFVAFLAFLLRLIPTAGLAAILVYTGYKLVNPKSIKKLAQYGRSEVAIYIATVVTIVATDLLTGVIVGIALSAAKLLYTFSHLDTRLVTDSPEQKATLSLSGSATFLRLPRLAAQLEKVPASAELHVDFSHLDYIDHACLDHLMNWARQHESTGGRLVIDWESLHARFRPDRENGRNGNGTESKEGEAAATDGKKIAGPTKREEVTAR